MSVYETLRPLPNGGDHHASSRLRNRAPLAARRLAQRAPTETALRGLSDAQLADIGLHRGEIAEVAGTLAGR